jgi:hypothetical protein
MIKIFGIATMFAVGGVFLEIAVTKAVPYLSQPSNSFDALPRSFGLFVIVITFLDLWIVNYSSVVGKARKTYMEIAAKNGEKDTDKRYSLPNMYVDGSTKPALSFTCVQRSPQHIMESIAQFNMVALMAALNFPIVAALLVSLHTAGRMTWCKSYANSEGEPGKRYDHPLAFHIWTSMLGLAFLAFISGFVFLL